LPVSIGAGGACLAITDINVCAIYGEAMQRYFAHHGIDIKIFRLAIDEEASRTKNSPMNSKMGREARHRGYKEAYNKFKKLVRKKKRRG